MDCRDFFNGLSEGEQEAMKRIDEEQAYYVADKIEEIKAIMIDMGQDNLSSSVNQKIADLLLGESSTQ